LETYKGIYDGHEENFQFFFADKKLRRIGVYLYEGYDLQAAGRRWLGLLDSLGHHYGHVETPDNPVASPTDEVGRQGFVVAAISAVEEKTKTQMAPVKQPPGSIVFSSFWRADVEGRRKYYVVVYFDRPP
jgi:hypothetical protein